MEIALLYSVKTLSKPGKIPGVPDYKFFDLRDPIGTRIAQKSCYGKEEIEKYEAVFAQLLKIFNENFAPKAKLAPARADESAKLLSQQLEELEHGTRS